MNAVPPPPSPHLHPHPRPPTPLRPAAQPLSQALQTEPLHRAARRRASSPSTAAAPSAADSARDRGIPARDREAGTAGAAGRMEAVSREAGRMEAAATPSLRHVFPPASPRASRGTAASSRVGDCAEITRDRAEIIDLTSDDERDGGSGGWAGSCGGLDAGEEDICTGAGVAAAARAAGGCSDGPRLGEAGVGLGGAADGTAAGVVGVGVFQCPVCGGAFPGGEREADMHVEECLSAGALADIAASGAAGSPWGACTPRKRRCSRVG